MLGQGLWEKRIYFLELNWINVSIVLMFRLAGIRVYYLTMSPFWQKENKILKLNDLGIIWLNYQDFLIKGSSTFLVKTNELMGHIRSCLSQTSIFYHLKKQFGLLEYEELSFNSLVIRSINSRIQLLSKLLIFAELIEGESTRKVWLWIPNDFFSRKILEKEGGWINICPRWWTLLDLSISAIRLVVGVIVKQWRSFNHSLVQKKIHIEEKKIISNDNEIIYFPHHGIWYSNLFLKDYFYSTDKDSPFYASKILHISLGEGEKTIEDSIQYYKEHGISYTDWFDIPGYSKLQIGRMVMLFCIKCVYHICIKFDLTLFFVLLKIYIKFKFHILLLRHFPNLKIVLVGYDILFPFELALACRNLKITTIAVQERMISAWWTWPIMLDHYFIYGPASREILNKRFGELLNKKYEIGPIRLNNHKASLDIKDDLIKSLPDYKYRVLVLDSHSDPGYYDNGRSAGNNWRINKKFYQNILNLCASFPQAHFMIKGKNYDFINIHYFTDIVENIEQTPNCMLVKDYEQWTPFTSVTVSDIAIALHTSLGDEMLALGKPVIFYEYYTTIASEFFDYGSEVVSFTFEDVKLKLTSFFENPDKYNQSLNSIRNKCFNVSNETPKQLLDKGLIEIYREQTKRF